jgi:hypothetical protein
VWQYFPEKINVVNFQSFNSYLANAVGCTRIGFGFPLEPEPTLQQPAGRLLTLAPSRPPEEPPRSDHQRRSFQARRSRSARPRSRNGDYRPKLQQPLLGCSLLDAASIRNLAAGGRHGHGRILGCGIRRDLALNIFHNRVVRTIGTPNCQQQECADKQSAFASFKNVPMGAFFFACSKQN